MATVKKSLEIPTLGTSVSTHQSICATDNRHGLGIAFNNSQFLATFNNFDSIFK